MAYLQTNDRQAGSSQQHMCVQLHVEIKDRFIYMRPVFFLGGGGVL